MNIRNDESIPQEVEDFLLAYEANISWTETSKDLEEQIELIVVTNTDIFEGALRYYNNQPTLKFVVWNSWYNDPPEIFQLTREREEEGEK